MKNSVGVRFDLVGQVPTRLFKSITRNRSEEYSVDPINLCFALNNIAKHRKFDVVYIKIHARYLSLPVAFDISQQIKKCKASGIDTFVYSDYLNLSILLIMAYAHVRCSPPLAGPLSLSVHLEHFQFSGVTAKVGISLHAMSDSLLKLRSFDSDQRQVNSELYRNDVEIAEAIAQAVLTEIKRAIGHCSTIVDGQVYSTASEAAEAGLLTHVTYDELMYSTDTRFSSVRWKKPDAIPNYIKINRLPRRIHSQHLILLSLTRKSLLLEQGNISCVIQAVQQLSQTNKAGGLLLVIDFMGGDLSEADRLWCLIMALRRYFPIVAYVRRATSAGYCVASAASEIVVNPGAIIGSIGTVTVRPDATKLLNTLGARVEFPISKNGAVIGNPFLPLTAIEYQVYQRRARIGSSLFATRVAIGRSLPEAEVRKLTDGQIFSAEQAVELKLADKVGTITSALDKLIALSGSHSNKQLLHLKPTESNLLASLGYAWRLFSLLGS